MSRFVATWIFSLFFVADASVQAPSISTKRIALTFDDAPRGDGPMFTGDERASVLVATLKQASAGPVAFFVTTRDLDKPGRRARVARYASAGHLIANHSHTHQWLLRTDTDAYIADIDIAARKLDGLQNRPWFRFPFLDEGVPLEKRDAVRAALLKRRLVNGYVTVDNYDWYLEQKWAQAKREGRTVDLEALKGAYVDMLLGAIKFYDDLAVRWLKRSPVHTLLLHENDVGALFIDDLIVALRAQGWQIVSPDEAYADPVAAIEPVTLMTRQGHVAALAVEAGVDRSTLSHRAIEEAQIDALLEERRVFGDAPTK